MKFRIGKDRIRIRHNENNSFWKPIGMFFNISEIKIGGEWYKCSLKFERNESKSYVQVSHPMKVDPKTSQKTEVYHEGIFKELPISKLKMNIIKLLLNAHPWNYRFFDFKRTLYKRRNSIIVFSIAIIISAAFYLINANYNSILIEFIAKNLWCQTLIMFLTTASFINIFYPFALRKELNKKDVETISKDTMAKEKEEEKINEEIEKEATF